MAVNGSSGGGASAGAVRAGRAFVELFADDKKLWATMGRLKSGFAAFGSMTAKIGAGLFGAGSVGGGLALKGVLDTLSDTASLGNVAKSFGLTAEQFTGIAGVAKSAGEDTREFIESMVTLGKVASEGAAGKGEVAVQFFKDLGLGAKEFAQLRPDEQFYRFFEAVQTVKDPLKQVRLLMVAFGEDGGKYLLPLLAKTPGQLRAMGQSFAITSEEMGRVQSANMAVVEATNALSAAWRSVTVAVAPVVETLAGWVTEQVKPLTDWIKANREAVASMAKIAIAATAAGAAMVAFGVAVGPLAGAVLAPIGLAITAVTGGIGAMVAGITGTVGAIAAVGSSVVAVVGGIAGAVAAVGGLLVAAKVAVVGFMAALGTLAVGAAVVGGLAAAFLYLTDTGEKTRDVLSRMFSGDFSDAQAAVGQVAVDLRSAWGAALDWLTMKFGATAATMVEAWGGVVAAVQSGNLEGAANIAFAAVRVAYAQLMLFLTERWIDFKGIFIDGWYQLSATAQTTWANACAEIDKQMTQLRAMFDINWTNIAATIGKALLTAVLFPVSAPVFYFKQIAQAGIAAADLIAQAFRYAVSGKGTTTKDLARAAADAIDAAVVPQDQLQKRLDAIEQQRQGRMAEINQQLQQQLAQGKDINDAQLKTALENLNRERDNFKNVLDAERKRNEALNAFGGVAPMPRPADVAPRALASVEELRAVTSRGAFESGNWSGLLGGPGGSNRALEETKKTNKTLEEIKKTQEKELELLKERLNGAQFI